MEIITASETTEEPDIDEFVNTLDTLGVTPRFILQHNAVSRSLQNLSVTAKKLAVMAMSLLPADLSSRSAAFTFTEFSKAMGVSIGGNTYELFKAAADECMKCIIKVETNKIVKGKRVYEQLTWFTYSRLEEETGLCTMTFSQELTAFLKEMKRVYAKINLQDLGKLQSKYAIRIFEIAKSYESLKGKDGNKEGQWYFERELPELRKMLGVPEDAYSETKRFRQFAVENPVKEINDAGIGIKITAVGVKQGRSLKKMQFDCAEAPRTVTTAKRRRGGKTENQEGQSEVFELADMELKSDAQKEVKELEHLKELYPEEFAALYAEALVKRPFMSKDSQVLKLAAEGSALTKLREKYGIVK